MILLLQIVGGITLSVALIVLIIFTLFMWTKWRDRKRFESLED